jgi:hypothetical protein
VVAQSPICATVVQTTGFGSRAAPHAGAGTLEVHGTCSKKTKRETATKIDIAARLPPKIDFVKVN